MPVIRTKNAVLVIGTAIGLAAACGSVSAQTHDQNSTRMAQMRGDFGGRGGSGGAAGAAEEEKKKQEEEKRKREQQKHQQQQQQQRLTPKGGSHGGPGGGLGGPGGGRDDHRGRTEERQPRTFERAAPPQQPSQFERKRYDEERDRRPGPAVKTPSGQPSPLELKKKEEDFRRGQAGEKGHEPPKSGPGGIFGKPPAGQPSQLELKKKEEDLRKGQAGEKGHEPPKGGPGGIFGKPPTGQPSQLELKKKEEDLRKGQAGEKGQEPPKSGPGGIFGKPPVGQPAQIEKKDEYPRNGHPGGIFDKRNQPKGTGSDRIEKSGRPHLDAPPILPKPSQVELDRRRQERATFSREHLKDISKQRHERKDESGRVILEEPGNRHIIRENGRAFIRHDETQRLRHGTRDFREERGPGGERRHYYTRADGVVIISIQGEDGRLIKRMRRERDGREVIIINNDRERWHRHRGRRIAGFGFVVDLAPPVIRIPQEEYYVDTENASEDDIYEALSAPPVDDVEADYTLDEIRYSPSLRDRLRRVNLSTISFEFGSWEVTEDQIGRLEVVAKAMRAILRRNPDEVFLIGGHTDAVGSDEDNLSLSDRRAESVARVLTDEYGIPAENLVTQGYGEQQLLVQTEGPERRNRRVEFQRITPLLARK